MSDWKKILQLTLVVVAVVVVVMAVLVMMMGGRGEKKNAEECNTKMGARTCETKWGPYFFFQKIGWPLSGGVRKVFFCVWSFPRQQRDHDNQSNQRA